MPYQLRQNPEDICSVQQSIDAGLTWTEAFRMDNCCCDDGSDNITRIVDGIIEESPDGGETWTPIDDDPRFIGILLPPREGANAKCDAAQSTIDMIQAHFDQLIADVNLGASVTAIIAAVIALLAIVVSLGTLTPLILPLASAIFWAGGAAIESALTASVYDRLLCLIYCNSEDDGSYTQAGWQNLRADIVGASEITGLAEQLIKDYITLLGSVGLSNAASYNPTAVGDCSECDCGCSEGCSPVTVAYTYNSPAWIAHGAYTRYSAGTPVGQFDSFTLWGTTAVLDIGGAACITKVELVVNNGCPGTGGQVECFINGVSQGAQTPLDKVGCSVVPSTQWNFAGGIPGDQISFVQTTPHCAGGYDDLLICVRITTCE